MLAYLLKRLLLAAATMFAILLVSYLLLRLAPGDPTKTGVLGQDAGGSLASDRTQLGVNEALRKKLHLDKPIHEGFIIWLQAALHGDFGTSATVEPGRPVTEVIMSRLPVTLRLNLLAILLTYLLAIPIGIAAAWKPDSLFDRSSAVTMFMLYSLPVIWVGLVPHAAALRGLLCAAGDLSGVCRIRRNRPLHQRQHD
ncbi:MAG: ABC transporter permease [Victivallaceae bacterium]|nr:ABC transporter permease [Victivallaceae bacterium]